jgi:hypothetical protein
VQPCRQVCAENTVFRSQVFVLQEEFLVHQPRDIRQQTSPLIAVHANLLYYAWEWFPSVTLPLLLAALLGALLLVSLPLLPGLAAFLLLLALVYGHLWQTEGLREQLKELEARIEDLEIAD